MMFLLRAALVAAATLGMPALAAAQSCPTFTTGMVPTAAQWNACFNAKQAALGYTPVNKAGDVMTGALRTFPSTVSAAGFAVPPGTAPTSPSNGDMWSTSAGFFVRVAGATVGPLSGPHSGAFAATAPLAVAFPSSVVTYSITGAAGQVLAGAGPAFTSTPTLGVAGSTVGTLSFANLTTGSTTIQPGTGALGSTVLTLPIATDTLIGKATSDVLTNKTYDTAGSGNSFSINGVAVTANTGTGAVARAAAPTFTTPVLGVATGTSLALGGCTIGSNALCTTGTAAISSTLTSAAHTITSASASALTVGLNGATNPALQVDASTGSSATGLKIKSAAAAGGLALSVVTSGTNEALTIDAAGAGTITLGGTSTGAIINTRATTLSAALTYGGVTLSNSVTGTGSMVLATAPTVSALVVTGSFTATGLVGNAALVNSSITVNTQTCTLGSSCTITATAASVTVGTTTIASGTTTRILYDNAGTLGEYTISGSGTVVAMATGPSISALVVTSSFTATGLVANASLADMATTTIKGRALASGTGAPTDLTAAQVAAVVGSVGGTLKSILLSFTRDISTATGSQAVTGAGFVPTACQFVGGVSGSTSNVISWGMVDSARTSGAFASIGNMGTTGGINVSTNAIQFITDVAASNVYSGTISSYDSDGFTIAWVKSGSPTGTATIKALCTR